jgi:hypothetical protein
MVRYPVKPGGEAGALLVGGQRLPAFQECLLRQIRRLLITAAQASQVPKNALIESSDQVGCRFQVAFAGAAAKYLYLLGHIHFNLLVGCRGKSGQISFCYGMNRRPPVPGAHFIIDHWTAQAVARAADTLSREPRGVEVESQVNQTGPTTLAFGLNQCQLSFENP